MPRAEVQHELKGVWIDPKLHRAVKIRATREDRTIRELVEEALRSAIATKPKAGAA